MILAALLGLPGCGREFFRNWADQDVTEAVFEKSRDPRWRIDLFSIEPPSLSRFADPYDPDRPPAPPDDPAAEALSPMPQRPRHRLLVPNEGTGYITMLEAWRRDRPFALDEEEQDQDAAGMATDPETPPPPPVPDETSVSPFQSELLGRPFEPGGLLDSTPGPGPDAGIPEDAPGGPGTEIPPPELNSGRPDGESTPIPLGTDTPPAPISPTPDTNSGARDPQARTPLRDPGVQLSALQTTVQPAPTAPGSGSAAAPAAPDAELTPPVEAAPGEAPTPSGVDPLRGPPLVPGDPLPYDVDLTRPADPRTGLTPEGYAEAGRTTAGLASLLSPARIPFDQEEAAALPQGSRPYVVTAPQALTLALTNSRAYQTQVENIYLAALDVTLSRWQFTPQFYAGVSPTTGTAAGTPANANTSFLYRTREAVGGQSSILNIGTAAGVGKVLSFGGRIAAGFANQIVFNFTGANPVQPSVRSTLPLTFVQPFLRGGGRAVTLEPLTLAERNLLYSIRDFARFRQSFFPNVLTGSSLVGGTGGDPSVGFLSLLQQAQVVENTRRNVAAFEQLLQGYTEMAQGGGSGVSQLNVDQVDLNLQSARLSLLTNTINYQRLLDQYKLQLGLPPDLPLVPDRGLTHDFRAVFDRIDLWFRDEDRDPEDLPGFVEGLPDLPDVILDGRQVVADGIDPNRREDILLAAERIALENRYELMNQRAQLYDSWRQIAVRANALQGAFNIGITNTIFTPADTTNPFAFSDQAKQFNLTLNTDLPLNRLNERNAFRQGLILYRRQQRALMQLEDQIKFEVRNDVRELIRLSQSYEIEQRRLVVSLQQRDNTARTIFAPPGSSTGGSDATAQTNQLVQSQNSLLQSQNQLIQIWVNYLTQRISLYSDLGIIPYEEWEAYHELFPAESARPDDRAAAGGARPAPARAADAAQGNS